jgi:RNA polymerase sigma factor (TIGR02999 family)
LASIMLRRVIHPTQQRFGRPFPPSDAPQTADRTRLTRRSTADAMSEGLRQCFAPRVLTNSEILAAADTRMRSSTRKELAMSDGTDLSELIRRVNSGDAGARDALFAAAYAELRKLARSRLHDGGRNTMLDTTALVHESYLRFLQVGQLRSDDRRAFFAYASRVMRSVIIDAVRERQAERRGGDLQRLTLNTQVSDSLPSGENEMLNVHEALDMLAQAEPRLAKVVEMRYFGGYSEAEIGEALDLTERTVRRDWDKARLLLGAMLKE